jgi:DNA-binding beta-propeller fold protein YncE
MRRIPIVLGLLFLTGCASSPPRVAAPPVTFPPPPAQPRIQYLTHLSSSRQVVPERGKLARIVFGSQEDAHEIAKPYGLAIADGVIYVCDTKLGLVSLFDLKNERYGFLSPPGGNEPTKPLNLCVDPNGAKYVADTERGEILIYDAADAYVGAFGREHLKRPVDLAVDLERIFVCDAGSSEIVVFSRSSREFLYRFGGPGTGPGRFARPTNVELDGEGSLYVSDTLHGRIQKLDARGEHLSTIGMPGDRPGQFARPKGMAVDHAGRLYVVDAAFENVQIFDPEGRLLLFFAGPGQEPGQLTLPAQIVVDYDSVEYFRDFAAEDFEIEYLILVSSQYGPRKISVYAFGESRSGS